MSSTQQNTALIEARGLAKSFRSGGRDIPVIGGLDLSVRAGESISVRGESGSGKTTLLNMLAALESPDAGEVLWHGSVLPRRGLAGLGPRRAKLIGMIFQAYHLVGELNLLENVFLAARIAGNASVEARDRAKHLLERVGLGERLKSAPNVLSGGERQRVAIARALMNHPPVILADEPTGNLDEHTGDAVMDLLLEVCREEATALVLVTHNPVYASRTARKLFLHDGVFRGER